MKEAKRKGQHEREMAMIRAETAAQTTERDIKRASAEAVLVTRKTELNTEIEIARITATRKTEAQDEELKRDVELKRVAAELERLRVAHVVPATIERQVREQAAEANADQIRAEARANSERQKQLADAFLYTARQGADARLQ